MIAHKIANLIKFIAPETYNVIVNRGRSNYAIEVQNKKEIELKNKSLALLESFKLKFPIGGFVIAIPNEAVNPIVGRIVEYYDCDGKFSEPLLKVFDYIKEEEFIIPCTTFPFNETILSAVMAQNAQERHASYYGGKGKVFVEVEELIPDLKTIQSLLHKNGFYKDFHNFQKQF